MQAFFVLGDGKKSVPFFRPLFLILAIFKEVTGAKVSLTDIFEIYLLHRVKLINCIALPASKFIDYIG